MTRNVHNALAALVLILTALAGVATAQPEPPPPPPDPSPVTDPAPPDPAPPPPAPAPPPAPTPVVTVEPVEAVRPTGFSIGLGAGYGLPTSLETPNRTSARLRLPSGLTFEPLVTIANTSEEVDMAGAEAENKQTTFGVNALMRLPVVTHNRVDLEILATAGFTTTKDNPEGDFNTRTVNTFSIGYGVGIAYWLSRHWNVTFSVTNPIVSYDSAKQQVGPGMSNKTSDTTIGVIFIPSVFAMIHLYN